MSPTPPMGAKKTTPPSMVTAIGSGRKSSPSSAGMMQANAISSGTPTGRPPPYKRSSTSPQINEVPPAALGARQNLVARSVENVTVEEQLEEEVDNDTHDNVESKVASASAASKQSLRRSTSDSAALAASEEAESSCILS